MADRKLFQFFTNFENYKLIQNFRTADEKPCSAGVVPRGRGTAPGGWLQGIPWTRPRLIEPDYAT
jgi:hypothetical protein